MQNFDLYNPTRILFGTDQIEKLPELVPKNTKILLAYGGGSIFANGIHKKVTAALDGYDITEFGGIEPNPHYETLMKAVHIARTQNIGFILAVGGGSVIDGVKFISAAVKYKGNAMDILHHRLLLKDNTLPFGTVLTLPATGSEMNSGAVITIQETQEKLSFGGPALFPQFSICDPTVIRSLPKRQIQNGVVDAFTHVMEQYLTYPHEGYLQDRLAEAILITLAEIGPQVVEDPENYALASNFMWCCTMALNGILNKGVPTDWATHMIGHELTALYNIDHARTLAIIAPRLYTVMFETKKEKLAQYGRRVFGLHGADEEVAKEAIVKTESFFQAMGMDTRLSKYTEDYQRSADFIVDRFDKRGWRVLGERQNITLHKIKEIVEQSY
ncbi:MAG TPA: iron-containing alcohol dehydrogenase [Flavobacterium sp.]|jgi:NADP-dependent alcohol dehydrogenase